MMYHWSYASEVIVRRRSCGRPLQSCCLPGIVAGLRPFEHAPKEIDDEDELRGDRNERGGGHERVQRNELGLMCNLGELRIAARLAGDAEIVHRHEDSVGSG